MALSTVRLQETMSQQILIAAINDNFALLENLNVTQIFKNKDGVPQIILGRYPDGTYGLKISRDGVDVLTASDDDLIFNSANNLFKIVDSGEVPLTMPTVVNGTSQSVSDSAPHTLGYSPLVVAFISYPSPGVPGSTYTRMFGSGTTQARSVSVSAVTIGYVSDEAVEATTTDVNFRWTVSNATGVTQAPIVATVKYYLLTETAS